MILAVLADCGNATNTVNYADNVDGETILVSTDSNSRAAGRSVTLGSGIAERGGYTFVRGIDPDSSMRHKRQRSVISLASAILPLIVAAPAPAQEAAGESEIETIVVTGSRLDSSLAQSVSPIVSVGPDQLQFERAVNVEDLLSKLSQTAGGIGAASTTNDAFGASVLDLRGLGQNRTLVLIDGSRGAPFGFRNSVDVNSIPAPLVERVEILTGGSAAVYGADAVVGVVNFKLKDDFEGLEANASYEVSRNGDGALYNLNVGFGETLGGQGHIAGFIGYSNREEILAGRREFASPEFDKNGDISTNRPAGGVFTQGDSAFSFTDTGAFTTTAQGSEFSGVNTLIQPLERIDTSVFFSYDVFDNIEVHGRAMFSNSRIRSSVDPVDEKFTVTVRYDNPYLTPDIVNALTFDPNGEASVGVQRTFAEFGPETRNTTRKNFQTRLGLRGQLTESVKWDAYVQYGRSDDDTVIDGEGSVARMLQAANATVDANGTAVCMDASNDCAPANLFGPNSLSRQSVDFITLPLSRDRSRDQFVTAGTLSGDMGDAFSLPAGPIDWFLGFEYRDEKASEQNDSAIVRGQTFDQGRRPSFAGAFDVTEFFGEARVPILVDLPFARRLDIEGAYRNSDFSTSGSHDTWKIGASWTVNDDLRFRGSVQHAIRSPNIGELFGPLADIPLSTFINGDDDDPCSNPALTGADPAQCAARGAPAAPFTVDVGDAPFVFGGNPDLQPEESGTYTIGASFNPSALPGFSVAVDYFDIDIDGGVFVVFPADALRDCYIANPTPGNPLCDLVPRDPATGQIALADATDQNVSSFTMSGVDIDARYTFDLPVTVPGEHFSIRYTGTVVTDQTRRNSQYTTKLDCKGTFSSGCAIDSRVNASFRHRATFGWDTRNLAVQAAWQMVGSVENPSSAGVTELAAEHYVDLAAIWYLKEGIQLSFGIDNLFDNEPPFAPGTAVSENFNTFPSSYDVIGRTYGVAMRFRSPP